jgi:hypothetical protein
LHKSIGRGNEPIQQIDDRYLLLEFVAARAASRIACG